MLPKRTVARPVRSGSAASILGKALIAAASSGTKVAMSPALRMPAAPGRINIKLVPNELMRSEEHTSELQSLTNLVCRLLLEKKKTTAPINCAQHERLSDNSAPVPDELMQ